MADNAGAGSGIKGWFGDQHSDYHFEFAAPAFLTPASYRIDMKKPRAWSPVCGVIVASLPLSRTNRAILQQPFGFELTVPACLDSNQASATDPRPPNSSRSVAGMSVNAYTLMGRRPPCRRPSS